MKQPSCSTATKEELPGTIISNKAEMVQDIQYIKHAYFNMKMTFIICNIAIQNDLYCRSCLYL